jgi:hypothetical protein
MQHLRITTYSISKGTFQEIAENARATMLRTFQEQPGFVRYGMADLGNKTCMSISMWETREQAEASAFLAATWLRENLVGRIEVRTNSMGQLAFFKGVPTAVQAVPAIVQAVSAIA